MAFSSRTRYLLLFFATVTGAVIELVRGYRPVIVVVGFVVFLLIGFVIVYLSGSKERAIRRRQKREYYAG